MSRKTRINRFLASAGMGSRRKCETLIREGRVRINGEVVTELARYIDPGSDTISVDGVNVESIETRIVLAVNKPRGVLSTVSDEFGRRTVMDMAREKGYERRLFPVGRLDKETTGILLLTDDGELSYRLTHPKHKVEKTYVVEVDGFIDEETVGSVSSGVDIGGVVTSPCEVKVASSSETSSILEVRLKEGRKRQIRRMFSAVGYEVLELKRTAIGDLEFTDLEPGEMRPLTEEEEKRLKELAKLL